MLSATEDRICQHGGQNKITLSAQEFLDCGSGKSCKGGDAAKVLAYGKRKGFVEDTCYKVTDGKCPEDNFEAQECRAEKDVFKLVDHCFAQGIEGVKAEIIANGPVLAQISPQTDFLTYSDGVY